MKIVVLDGYTLNPGDLSWGDLAELGDLVVNTGDDGSFVISVPGPLIDDNLRIRGDLLAGDDVYPFVTFLAIVSQQACRANEK